MHITFLKTMGEAITPQTAVLPPRLVFSLSFLPLLPTFLPFHWKFVSMGGVLILCIVLSISTTCSCSLLLLWLYLLLQWLLLEGYRVIHITQHSSLLCWAQKSHLLGLGWPEGPYLKLWPGCFRPLLLMTASYSHFVLSWNIAYVPSKIPKCWHFI